MYKLWLIVMISFFVMCKGCFAQEKYYFTNGLTVNGIHRYGREALYSDKLAYQLYTNTIKSRLKADHPVSTIAREKISSSK